ncbi:uncharacterized protein IL334_003197 [Kwoniella shivajii]|uniref:SURP motif domain-containing protein n=1 Tax=Kwoniella shivajii TaxID=564305 RepID=A0ABZ1CYM1_9TREE|nr:hypothetical protein IL334_003197 [Kwoniella shivajii]
MYPRPSKRSHPPHRRETNHNSQSSRSGPSTSSNSSTTTQIPPIAYIQAYEAQLVYNQHDIASEVASRDTRSGLGLIRYAGELEVDDQEREGEGGVEERGVWADRHDIIHLLPSLTVPISSTSRYTPSSPASSSSSWNSLPSDVEETFYLSDPEEIEAHEIKKKKKWIEALRNERLKEREREDNIHISEQKQGWNDDEEPPEPILALMQHTAKAISISPNPSILELRILTNHSKDDRFLFLKGQYKKTWEKVKDDLRKKNDEEKRKQEKIKGLGGLGNYASDSDSDSDESQNEEEGTPPPSPPSPPPPPPKEEVIPPAPEDTILPPPPEDETLPPRETGHTVLPGQRHESLVTQVDDEEEKKRLRRARMEEWKKKRAAEKEA